MSDLDRSSNETCAHHRAALLTADPDELRGTGDSELAQHIRECARCAADGQRILGTTAMLAARLDRSARRSRARAPTSNSDALPVWWALPIAAVLSSVLIGGQKWLDRDAEVVPRVGALQKMELPVDAPVVNVPVDRNVAVFRTTDNITVVWDLGAKGGS